MRIYSRTIAETLIIAESPLNEHRDLEGQDEYLNIVKRVRCVVSASTGNPSVAFYLHEADDDEDVVIIEKRIQFDIVGINGHVYFDLGLVTLEAGQKVRMRVLSETVTVLIY